MPDKEETSEVRYKSGELLTRQLPVQKSHSPSLRWALRSTVYTAWAQEECCIGAQMLRQLPALSPAESSQCSIHQKLSVL